MNVIVLNSRDSLLPEGFTAIHVEISSEIEEQALKLKHKHERCVILNTSAEAVLCAYNLSLSIINDAGEYMYSVVDSHNSDQLSDTFYTINQIKIAALVESIRSIGECKSNRHRIVAEIEKAAEFIGHDTLQDILRKAAKSTLIYEYITKCLAESRDAFESKVRSMILPASSEQIDNKTFVPKGFVVNASEMGTSKSESNMRLFDAALRAGRKPMLFVPNISLASPFSMRDEHYKNSCDADGRLIVKAGAITTINSAKISAHSELIKNGEVKIFDEANKLFEHINGDAFFEGKIADKRAGFGFVFDQMKAPDVVISDAHFGQAHINIIKGVTGREITAVEMPRGTYNGISVFAGNLKVEDLIHMAKRLLKAGKSFAFGSDRKQQDAVAIYKELADFADAHGLKSILLNAAEMANDQGDAYKATVNPDSELADKSMILFTPAIGPGFSARLPSVQTVLMDCCGTVSPLALIQSTFRFRCVKEIHMAFSVKKPAFQHPETRSDVCYRAIDQSEALDSSSIDDTDSVVSFMSRKHQSLMADPVMCAAFDFKALENWSRNRYKKFVLTAMSMLGFNMNKAFTDADDVAFEKPKKLARIKAEKEETKKTFISGECLSQDAATALKNKGKSSALNLHESRLLEKYTAGEMMGIDGAFTEDDYSFVEKGGLQVVANLSLLTPRRVSELTNDVRNKSNLIRDVREFVLAQVSRADGFQNEALLQFTHKLKSEKLIFNGKEITKATLFKTYFMMHIDVKYARKSVSSIMGLLGYKLITDGNAKIGRGAERKNKVTIVSDLHDTAMRYLAAGATMRKKASAQRSTSDHQEEVLY